MSHKIAIFRDQPILEPSWSELIGQLLRERGVDVLLFDRIDHATLDKVAAHAHFAILHMTAQGVVR